MRSLVNGVENAYPLGDGRFGITGLPIEGVNPPKAAGVPPLNKDVPCETQQPPDLRTTPDAPPQAIKINHRSVPAEVVAAQREKAVEWLRSEIKARGLTDLKIPAEVPVLKAHHLKQLSPALANEGRR